MDMKNVSALAKKAGKVCPKYELMVHFGVKTGLRISDILALKVGAMREGIRNGVVSVCEKKTGKYRLVVLDELIGALFAKLEGVYTLVDTDYVFFSRPTQKHRPLSRQQAWRIMHRADKDLGTHSLRKTFAKNFYERTGDLEALQKLLNHKHVDTTLAYLVSKIDLYAMSLRILGLKNISDSQELKPLLFEPEAGSGQGPRS
jgi:integrase